MPKTLTDALLAPWQLAVGGYHFSEHQLRDPRLLVGCLIGATGLAFALMRGRLRQPWALCLTFFMLAYAAWLEMHAVYRYTVTLESLVAISMSIALLGLKSQRLRLSLGLSLTLGLLAYTSPPDWGRTEFSTPMASNAHPPFAQGSVLVSVSDDPLGYTAIDLPAHVPFLGLASNLITPDKCTPMLADALDRLHAAHSVWIVQPEQRMSDRALAAAGRYRIEPEGECVNVQSSVRDFWLCPASYQGGGDCPVAAQ
jgi:hypothetical protein